MNGPDNGYQGMGTVDIGTLRRHLEATIGWLKEAQDAQHDGGVSAGYTILGGWRSSYPETTGYIIPTMMNYATCVGDDSAVPRTIAMAEWLLSVQNIDGSFPGGAVRQRRGPSVFNTGQILFGLIRVYHETGCGRFLEAAEKAGRWLTGVQESTGEWRRHDFLGHSHVYNVRTAWALVLLSGVTGESSFRQAGEANVAWAMAQADDDGFFHRCAFEPLAKGERYGLLRSLRAIVRDRSYPSFYTSASLHTIAYTLQGTLETSWLTGDTYAESLALKGAARLASDLSQSHLAGFYGPGWQPMTRSRCLTGVAQMAVVWLRLWQHGHPEYLPLAEKACSMLVSVQKLGHRIAGLRGAIAGSDPIWGAYLPFRYPNWAAKFTADAYLMLLGIKTNRQMLESMTVW